MALLSKLTWRRKPRDDAKPDRKDAPKDEGEEQSQVLDGIRVAKASQIMRGGR